MLRIIGIMMISGALSACAGSHTKVEKPKVLAEPECSYWEMDPANNYNNEMLSGMGCANDVNLKLMVSNPRDLSHGRGSPSADMQSAVNAVDQHYFGDPIENASEGIDTLGD